MTPDYTYGHTVTKSVNDYLTSQGGWAQVTDQVSPLGTQDFSQYLTNVANSCAEVIINVNWGRDAVLSVQQGQAVRLTPEDEDGDPRGPLPRQGSGSRAHRRRPSRPPTSGGRSRTGSHSPRCSSTPSRRNADHRSGMGPRTPATCSSRSGRAWSPRLAPFTRRTLSNSTRSGETFPSMVGRRALPPRGPPIDLPRRHRPRQKRRRT